MGRSALSLGGASRPPGPNRVPEGADFGDPVPGDFSYVSKQARLLVETALNSDEFVAPTAPLEWSQIAEPLDGADHTCELTLPGFDLEKLLTASGTLDQHFASVLAELTPDRRVRVVRTTGPVDRRVLFQGWPQATSLVSTPDRKQVSITCLSEGQEHLRHHEQCQITGSWRRRNPTAEWNADSPDYKALTGVPPVFNPEGKPNRSAEPLTCKCPNGQLMQIYLWAEPDEAGAEFWSYVQALRTLVYLCVERYGGPVSVKEFLLDTAGFATWGPVTGTGEDPWLIKCTALCENVSVASLNLDEAITLLCAEAGLHHHVPCRTTEAEGDAVTVDHFLRIVAPRTGGKQRTRSGGRRMRPPEIHDLPLERPLSVTTATRARTIALRNRMQHFDLTVDRRAISAPTFLGGLTEIEVSCLLRPGWLPSAEHHLDNLDVDDAGNPLEPSEAEANREAAKKFWREEFAPKWDVESGDPIVPTKYHRKHAEHAPVAKVFRLWIFPDDASIDAASLGRKSGPWGAHQYRPFQPDDSENPEGPVGNQLWWNHWNFGGGLLQSTTQSWAARWRPFGNTIGRRHFETTERSPIVRIHFGLRDENGDYTTEVPEPDDPGWIEFGGDVDILADRAGIHIGESDIWESPPMRQDPNDVYSYKAIEAYIDGHFWVQITATIVADERMRQAWRVGGGSFNRDRGQVIDLGYETFVRRLRRGDGAGNSFLAAQTADDPDYENRDDREAFDAHTKRLAEAIVRDTTAGNVEMFFTDDSIWPGDTISGCAGLGLRFNEYPVVTCKNHLGGPSPRTQYMLTDLRKNPEIGGE